MEVWIISCNFIGKVYGKLLYIQNIDPQWISMSTRAVLYKPVLMRFSGLPLLVIVIISHNDCVITVLFSLYCSYAVTIKAFYSIVF